MDSSYKSRLRSKMYPPFYQLVWNAPRATRCLLLTSKNTSKHPACLMQNTFKIQGLGRNSKIWAELDQVVSKYSICQMPASRKCANNLISSTTPSIERTKPFPIMILMPFIPWDRLMRTSRRVTNFWGYRNSSSLRVGKWKDWVISA